MLALFVSIGTVGVPGTAPIAATPLCASAGLPVAFIAVSQPISQIVDMGRTAVNVAGAANTAYIVAATERRLDRDLYDGRKVWNDDDLEPEPNAIVGSEQTAATHESTEEASSVDPKPLNTVSLNPVP